MISALSRIWLQFWPRLTLWGGIVVLILTALFYTRRAGQKAEQVAVMKQTLKNTRLKHETETTVDSLPDGAAANELLRDWSR